MIHGGVVDRQLIGAIMPAPQRTGRNLSISHGVTWTR